VFRPAVIAPLNGIAWWAVMLFVCVAGIELDLKKAWRHRRESGVAAALVLGVPLLFGCVAALGLLRLPGWIGAQAHAWQFVLGVGMACAVTALPILILLMEKLAILREPLGQRILRYASLDDVAIWGVLAAILMDWARFGRQAGFLLAFALLAWLFRRLMPRLRAADRWYAALVWLLLCGWAADWSGLDYMVGAFLSGAVMDADWFERADMDRFRHTVLLAFMPVFFLSTGLRTNWSLGGSAVLLAAAALLVAAVAGKLLGLRIAGLVLGWPRGSCAHRLAAADQGADHDHLRQRAARQEPDQQRDLHRAAADGGGEHHAHGADRGAAPAAGAGADRQGGLKAAASQREEAPAYGCSGYAVGLPCRPRSCGRGFTALPALATLSCSGRGRGHGERSGIGCARMIWPGRVAYGDGAKELHGDSQLLGLGNGTKCALHRVQAFIAENDAKRGRLGLARLGVVRAGQ
jgi:hypothetical protein